GRQLMEGPARWLEAPEARAGIGEVRYNEPSDCVRFSAFSRGQLYWHAVGSAPVGVRPGFLASEERSRIGQALGSDQMLESSKPMIIVMRAVIGFPAVRDGVELVGKRGCPFLPREMSLLGELDREREGLGLPRLGKHRLALILRQ